MAVIPKRIEKETQKLATELPTGVTCEPKEDNYRSVTIFGAIWL